jgi:hypothetical protein
MLRSHSRVTIPAGTTGIGLIATLDHSKSQGHSGYLVLEARYLARSDGMQLIVGDAFYSGACRVEIDQR